MHEDSRYYIDTKIDDTFSPIFFTIQCNSIMALIASWIQCIARRFDLDKIFINFNGVRLNPVDHVKYLGMYIDKYLNWNQHIRELSKKLSQANGILSKLRYNASIEVCISDISDGGTVTQTVSKRVLYALNQKTLVMVEVVEVACVWCLNCFWAPERSFQIRCNGSVQGSKLQQHTWK